jgi:hypothetical protein
VNSSWSPLVWFGCLGFGATTVAIGGIPCPFLWHSGRVPFRGGLHGVTTMIGHPENLRCLFGLQDGRERRCHNPYTLLSRHECSTGAEAATPANAQTLQQAEAEIAASGFVPSKPGVEAARESAASESLANGVAAASVPVVAPTAASVPSDESMLKDAPRPSTDSAVPTAEPPKAASSPRASLVASAIFVVLSCTYTGLAPAFVSSRFDCVLWTLAICYPVLLAPHIIHVSHWVRQILLFAVRRPVAVALPCIAASFMNFVII